MGDDSSFNGDSVRRSVRLECVNGLHLTPITALVKKASEFGADIRIRFDGKMANAKSAMDLMLLGATFGAELDVEVTGDDALPAMEAIASVLAEKRD